MADLVQTDPQLTNYNYRVIVSQQIDKYAIPGDPNPLVVVGTVPESFQVSQSIDWKSPWGSGLVSNETVSNFLALSGNRLVGQVMTMQIWQGDTGSLDFTVIFELRTWADPVADIVIPIQTLMKMSMPRVDSNGFLMSPGPILDEEGAKQLGASIANLVGGGVQAAKDGYSEDLSTKGADWNNSATPLVYETNTSTRIVNSAKAVYNYTANSGFAKRDAVENAMKNKISVNIGRWFSLNNVVITQVQHDWKTNTPDALTGIFQAATVTITFRPVFALTAEDIPNLIKPYYNQRQGR